jgi:hypothetical protein
MLNVFAVSQKCGIFAPHYVRITRITRACAREMEKNMAHDITSKQSPQGEIILYQPDETIRLEVRLEDDTVWLTQQQIIDLFQSSKANISEHIKNIYDQGELLYGATVRNFRTVREEGTRMVRRNLTYYNLDAIISIGFRVNAKRGIKFRQWANKILKEYLLRGYSINYQMQQLEQKMDSQQAERSFAAG